LIARPEDRGRAREVTVQRASEADRGPERGMPAPKNRGCARPTTWPSPILGSHRAKLRRSVLDLPLGTVGHALMVLLPDLRVTAPCFGCLSPWPRGLGMATVKLQPPRTRRSYAQREISTEETPILIPIRRSGPRSAPSDTSGTQSPGRPPGTKIPWFRQMWVLRTGPPLDILFTPVRLTSTQAE